MTLQSDNVIAAIDAARRDHERLISDHRKLPAATTLLEQRRRDFDQGAQYLAQVELRQVAENAWADLIVSSAFSSMRRRANQTAYLIAATVLAILNCVSSGHVMAGDISIIHSL